METHMTKPAPNQQRSFGAYPEAVLWAATGSLAHWNGLLAQVTDAYFRRCEFAG
jgi:hypothetical protein